MDSKISSKNILRLYVKAWIISVIIFISYILFIQKITFNDILISFFPLTRGAYWYFTAYTGAYFFIPLIQKAIKSMSNINLYRISLLFLFVFSFLPTVAHIDVFYIRQGYSMLWIIIMIIIGMSIHKIAQENINFLKEKKYYLKNYIISVLITFFLFV